MNNMKKGFTLIEIILSITLIVIVGVGSTVGFTTYKKYTKEKTLNNMDSEILTALKMYIETNNEVKNKVYNEKEGLAVSLQTLQNEGLIDFGDLNITDQEDYVVAFLTNESDCSDISTLKGWDFQDGKPLYICTDSNGNQNLFSVGADAENLSNATREVWRFVGTNPRNYINYSNKTYRIMYIESDDSLTIYSENDFSGVFSENQVLPVDIYSNSNVETFYYNTSINFETGYFSPAAGIDFSNNTSGTVVSGVDFRYVSPHNSTNDHQMGYSTYLSISRVIANYPNTGVEYTVSGYKIRLNPCMQIVSGTGSLSTPYILKNNC